MKRPAIRRMWSALSFIFCGLVVGSGNGNADEQQDWMSALHITMMYQTREAYAAPSGRPDLAKTLSAICKSLGNNFINGKGALGSGPFKGFECHTSTDLPSTTFPQGWNLSLSDTPNGIDVVVFFQTRKGREDRLSLTLPPANFYDKLMAQKVYTQFLALTLVTSLPAVFRIQTRKKKFFLPFRAINLGPLLGAKVPQTPERLPIFELDRETNLGIWRSRVLGSTQLKDGRWQPTGDLDRGSERPLFAHFPDGIQSQTETLLPVLQALHLEMTKLLDPSLSAKIKRTLIGTSAAGYLGYRFGYPSVIGSPLISATRLHSLFAEIRSGIVSGIRIYYDVIPSAKSTVGGFQPESLAWDRLTFGTSLGFNPGFIVERIDLTPKIGVWNFTGKFITDTADPASPLAVFNVRRALSLAIELGIEKHMPNMVLRGWMSQDNAVGSKTKGSVVSKRLGADFFWSGWTLFSAMSLKTTLIVFTFYEDVNLSRAADTGSATNDGSLEATSLSYQTGYSGLGIGVSW